MSFSFGQKVRNSTFVKIYLIFSAQMCQISLLLLQRSENDTSVAVFLTTFHIIQPDTIFAPFLHPCKEELTNWQLCCKKASSFKKNYM